MAATAILCLIALFLWFSTAAAQHCALSGLYHNVSVVAVTPRNVAAARAILTVCEIPCECHQWYSGMPGLNVPNLLLLSLTSVQTLTAFIGKADWIFLVPDLGTALQRRASLQHDYNFDERQSYISSTSTPSLDVNFYKSYFALDVLHRKWTGLAKQFPHRVTILCYGRSWQGRPLLALRLGAETSRKYQHLAYTNSSDPMVDECDMLRRLWGSGYDGDHSGEEGAQGGDDRVVFLNAAQHSREWLAPAGATYVAEYLATSKTWPFPDTVSVVIVPLANPDGYVWTDSIDRLHRKNVHRPSLAYFRSSSTVRNKSEESSYVPLPCIGVDLNRNWAADFNGSFSTSNDPCSNEYVGSHPFSEPETHFLRDLILHVARPRALIDLHTFGADMLGPYQFSADEVTHSALFDAVAAVAKPDGFAYSRGSTKTVLYPASGFMSDWACLNGILGYTLELTPKSSSGLVLGFFPATELILPAAQSVLRTIAQLARYASVAPANLTRFSATHDKQLIDEFHRTPNVDLTQGEKENIAKVVENWQIASPSIQQMSVESLGSQQSLMGKVSTLQATITYVLVTFFVGIIVQAAKRRLKRNETTPLLPQLHSKF